MNRKFMAVMMSAVLMAGTAGTTMPVFASESEAEQEDSGFLGSLLGGGGLSSLFSEDGELGKLLSDSELGGLFSEGGELSGLVAEDGPLAGIFAEDGPVANIFAEDGPLANALSEDGPVAQLFAEDGALAGLFGDASSAGDLLNQLADEGSELRSSFDGLVSAFTDENGNFDEGKADALLNSLGILDENNNLNLEEVGSLIEGLAGTALTDETEAEIPSDDEEESVLIRYYDAITAAAESYVLEANADSFDAADLNFFVPMITNAIEAEDGTIKVVGDFWQLNYNVDNDTLVEASGGSMPALLTMEKAEDGSLTVTEGRVAQDGEGNWADIESFCEEIGTTTDEYLAATNENNRELSLDSMILEYIGDHPEITRIEKNGSILSADDLQAEMEERFETMLMAIFAVFSDEEPVESMTEESMTEADL